MTLLLNETEHQWHGIQKRVYQCHHCWHGKVLELPDPYGEQQSLREKDAVLG